MDIFLTSFENATFSDSTQQDIEQMQLEREERSAGMNYVFVAGAIAITLYIIAIVVAFVVKEKTKIVGIILLVIAVATLIAIGFFGVIGFALLLAAGIVALRYRKPQPAAVTTGSTI
jgi:hypothetical protein